MNRSLDFKQIRREIMAHPWPLDPHLNQVAQTQPEFYFLANPSGQLIYLYLTQYVHRCCALWFERPFQDIQIFDWGCGKGQVSHLLKQQGGSVVSADVNEQEGIPVLGQAALKLEHPYLLPFESEQFDVVLSVGVLEHVPHEVESLRELRRVLRPGGLFFCFNLPYKTSWIQWTARLLGNWYHDRLYWGWSTRRLVQAQGFQLDHMWLRQLFPKNSLRTSHFRQIEALDQWLVEHTPLALLATSLEFVAHKPEDQAIP